MRKLATLVAAWTVGMVLGQYLLPTPWLLPAGALALLLGALGFLQKDDRRLRIFLLAIGLCAALCYRFGYAQIVQAPAEALAETNVTATLEVCGYPIPTDRGGKVTARLLRDGIHGVKVLYYGGASVLHLVPGDRITGALRFSSAATIRDTDITAFTSKGVFLLAYERGELTVEPAAGGAWRYLPLRLGHGAQEQLSRLYDGETAAFLQAILIGDTTDLSTQSTVDLSEVGLLHITSVSGLHCAFLLALIGLLVGKQRRRLLAAIAIPTLLFYMLLVGGAPSVIRACIMLILLLIAPLLGRESDAPTALSVALLLILLQNPFAIASIGLQLSFSAVLGILWVTPRVYRALTGEKKRGKVYRFVATSIATTAGALIFTSPLVAITFKNLVLISPISNLLCLWAASLAFSVGMVSLVVSFFWLPLGQLLAFVPELLTRYLLFVSHLLAQVPYHAIYFTGDALKLWMGYSYGLLGLCLLSKEGGRRKYGVAGVLCLVTLPCALWLARLPAGGTFSDVRLEIVALDVGQGESVLLRSGEHAALMDCGSSNRYLDPGTTAGATLLTMGCPKLDYLVLSHYHADHVNGVETLLARVKVDTLVVPDIPEDETGAEIAALAERYGIRLTYARESETYALGDATLSIYPPVGVGSTNEVGLSLVCTLDEFDLLVTGDMDGETEKKLLAAAALPDIEVMMVGHHGSKHSTTPELLDAVTPEVAIVSVGDNSYGHPTHQALGRLADAGATIYRTDLHGNVHISVN
ncbi:MAG: ComEC/Rec2 family competence protein [Oscillospiraceae bacterium]